MNGTDDMDEQPKLGERPIRMPRADLGAVFGKPTAAVPPARSAGLRGLALREDVPVLDTPAEAAPAQTPEPPIAAVPAPETPRARTAPPTPVEAGGETVSPITVYLPVSLRDRLRRHRQLVGHTLTTVVLDAVETVHGELDDLLAAHRPAPAGTLFRHRAAPRGTAAEPNVQVGLRPSTADLAVLDELVVRHGAPHRSALVAVALDRYLTTTRIG